MGVTTVYLSGMHSGPNPSPGLGMARSLRLADPKLRLIGIDYSTASSGLHSDVLDDVVCLPPWADIEPCQWAADIAALLADRDSVLVPGLDLEVRLLADLMDGHPRVLAPGREALRPVAKPATAVAAALRLDVPEYELDTGWASVDRFLRRSTHGAWVKGRHYEATRARTTAEAMAAGSFLESAWGDSWHIETHVPGQECGLAFCARDGRLLDAVFMAKTLLTAEGKTWSGEVTELAPDLWARVSGFVAEHGWTGGGEIELIRSWDGNLTVMEINPRFPAWIHGSTVCGVNLPHALLTGQGRHHSRVLGTGFTRVVEEIGVNAGLGLRPFTWSPTDSVPIDTKHPSGMRDLGRRKLLPIERSWADQELVRCPEHDLPPPDPSAATPRRELLPAVFTARAEALQAELKGLPPVTLAYSVKTCPAPAMMRAASAAGLVAEVITMDELAAAAAAGFETGQVILNGPAKWWPRRSSVRCRAFFADSMAELRQLRGWLEDGFRLSCDVVGLRVAPLGVSSRFGLQFADHHALRHAAALTAALCEQLGAGWGLHFHQAQSVIGPARWESEASAALRLVEPLTFLLGDPPAMVDLGGGWHADDLPLLRDSLDTVVERGPDSVRTGATELVLEPGKLLTEAAAAVMTRVLVHQGDDVVVDAALAEIPEAAYRPHPISRFDGHAWRALAAGQGRVLGRSCMENDVLATQVDLTDVGEGDFLAFGSCGSYDLSMAYQFGRGAAGLVFP